MCTSKQHLSDCVMSHLCASLSCVESHEELKEPTEPSEPKEPTAERAKRAHHILRSASVELHTMHQPASTGMVSPTTARHVTLLHAAVWRLDNRFLGVYNSFCHDIFSCNTTDFEYPKGSFMSVCITRHSL